MTFDPVTNPQPDEPVQFGPQTPEPSEADREAARDTLALEYLECGLATSMIGTDGADIVADALGQMERWQLRMIADDVRDILRDADTDYIMDYIVQRTGRRIAEWVIDYARSIPSEDRVERLAERIRDGEEG